jgi:hypothetical protein
MASTHYDQLLEQARGSAKYWIPKLCEALRKENSEMSNDDIRERVKKDCIGTWQRDTITEALPEEYKDKLRSELGKKGRQKQLEQAGGSVTAEILPDSNRANDDSNSSTGQKPQTFDRPSSEEMVSQSQGQSNASQELQEVKKGKAAIQGRENIEAPRLISEGAGLIKADNVKRINEFNSRGWAAFVHRYGDVIRRTIESDNKVSTKFFLLHKKDRVLVPVSFTVDFSKMTTSLLLDES